MEQYYHLFEPASGIHYANGGFIDPKSPAPFAGGQWLIGHAPEGSPTWNEITFEMLLDLIDTTLRTLPEESQAKFSPKFPEVLLLLQRKNYSTALLVFKNIETDTDAEAAIKKQISEILGAFL